MVFFKTAKGELIPFTAPLMKQVFPVSWPEEETKHRGCQLTCHGRIVYSYCTSKYRNLTPLVDTVKTYVFEAIEELVSQGMVNAIIDIKELTEDLT